MAHIAACFQNPPTPALFPDLTPPTYPPPPTLRAQTQAAGWFDLRLHFWFCVTATFPLTRTLQFFGLPVDRRVIIHVHLVAPFCALALYLPLPLHYDTHAHATTGDCNVRANHWVRWKHTPRFRLLLPLRVTRADVVGLLCGCYLHTSLPTPAAHTTTVRIAALPPPAHHTPHLPHRFTAYWFADSGPFLCRLPLFSTRLTQAT